MSLEQHERGIHALCPGGDGARDPLRVQVIVIIEVQHAAPLVSPAYDDGVTTESDMLETQRARFARLHDSRVRR
jgi:hypothetical protein